MKGKPPRCAAIEADLVAAASGEAAPEAAGRVQEHLEACAPCRQDFGRYRAIEGMLGRLRATSDDDTPARERLIARLGELRRRRLTYGVFPSPLGPLLIGRTEDGVSLVQYLDPDADVRGSLLGRRPDVEAIEDPLAVEAFYRELVDYLEGRGAPLSWPLDFRLARSDFHLSVLRATAAIPYGAVRSYAGIAGEIGKPAASRAVAQALRWNPLPIVVPCHRVVGTSGALVGYAGDKVPLKRRLLALEGVMRAESVRLSPRRMYVTLPRESFYCLPTCSWIPAAEDPHRFVLFGSRERAEAAGLAPCGDCRPDLHPLAA
jgi:O-6-methylguanine DNA methyltransferase